MDESKRINPMEPVSAVRRDALFDKAKLSVDEMTQLIADRVAVLPTVRRVTMADEGAIAVDLVGGKQIEVQAIPVARAFNASMVERQHALDELLKRCA
ncbi:hypothetical protein C2U72_23160 [Prosthecomicrobium hirschii]|nr:hypothetical protein C2U72_23160 [Prosthecomicrobium hirschii]